MEGPAVIVREGECSFPIPVGQARRSFLATLQADRRTSTAEAVGHTIRTYSEGPYFLSLSLYGLSGDETTSTLTERRFYWGKRGTDDDFLEAAFPEEWNADTFADFMQRQIAALARHTGLGVDDL